MTYLISDIHGQYEAYRRMLQTIRFSGEDLLYTLGDSIDRGPEPIRVLQDLAARPNVIPLLGNHEYMAYCVLRPLCVEITAENVESQISAELLQALALWQGEGGDVTLRAFRALPREEQLAMLDFMADHTPWEAVTVGGARYLLVHGGIPYESRHMPIEDQPMPLLITHRPDYTKRYFDRLTLVTGHTPTALIDPAYEGKIYRAHGHIAMDCGSVFGGRLGCICLETGEEFYS